MRKTLLAALLLLPMIATAQTDWGVPTLGTPDPAGKVNPGVTSEIINLARNSLYGWHGCTGFGFDRVCNAVPNGAYVYAEVAKYDPLEGNLYDGVFHVLFLMFKDPNGNFPDTLVFQGMAHTHNNVWSWQAIWPEGKGTGGGIFDE